MSDALDRLRVDPYARVPMAAQLSEQIAWLIASGQLARNDRLPAIRRLAARLGINLHTVAAAYRQLEGDGLVSGRRGRGTIVLGYDRSRRAAHTPDVPTSTLGVLVAEHSASSDAFLEALQLAGERDGVLLIVGVSHEDPRRVTSFLDRLVARNVDGILVATLGRPEDPALTADLLQAFAMPPIVFADLPKAAGPKVLFDLETGLSKATDHLLGHGHRRIGLLTGPPDWRHAEATVQGYRRAHDERGIPPAPELVTECFDLSSDAGLGGAASLLDLPLPPSAILAASSGLALGAMRAIRQRGLHIPSQIALVSGEDPIEASLVDPPLTAVRLPAAEMARQAISMLLTLIRGGTVRPSVVILPTQLVIRRSCGCPA